MTGDVTADIEEFVREVRGFLDGHAERRTADEAFRWATSAAARCAP